MAAGLVAGDLEVADWEEEGWAEADLEVEDWEVEG